MGIIIFNGISSKDLGVEVEYFPGYDTPEKEYDVIHVPGKNGDIYIDKGSYMNVSREYQIATASYDRKYYEMANQISEWLYSASGYCRLEDSYEPDYYRLAVFKGPINLNNVLNHAGRTNIIFDCKPQRFLKLGDKTVKFTTGGSILNPTNFNALPLITVIGKGSGALSINNYNVTITGLQTRIIIDSEIQEVYDGNQLLNDSITMSNGFPKLSSGINKISFSGGISSVEVVPKWWTL